MILLIIHLISKGYDYIISKTTPKLSFLLQRYTMKKNYFFAYPTKGSYIRLQVVRGCVEKKFESLSWNSFT